MNTHIALLRGIGGNRTLPSKILIELLDGLGCRDVKTYIATGNAVFRHRSANGPALAKRIKAAIDAERGFAPETLLLTPAALRGAVSRNPWRAAESEPATLHLFFLSTAPSAPDLDKLAALRANGERFRLVDDVFYLHAPAGLGRSKLGAQVEKAMGVWCTARNWRSVTNILALAENL